MSRIARLRQKIRPAQRVGGRVPGSRVARGALPQRLGPGGDCRCVLAVEEHARLIGLAGATEACAIGLTP
eukprot:435375-Alexandrium_andersonii.AAC.1